MIIVKEKNLRFCLSQWRRRGWMDGLAFFVCIFFWIYRLTRVRTRDAFALNEFSNRCSSIPSPQHKRNKMAKWVLWLKPFISSRNGATTLTTSYERYLFSSLNSFDGWYQWHNNVHFIVYRQVRRQSRTKSGQDSDTSIYVDFITFQTTRIAGCCRRLRANSFVNESRRFVISR